jgi:hypothetical protein
VALLAIGLPTENIALRVADGGLQENRLDLFLAESVRDQIILYTEDLRVVTGPLPMWQ